MTLLSSVSNNPKFQISVFKSLKINSIYFSNLNSTTNYLPGIGPESTKNHNFIVERNWPVVVSSLCHCAYLKPAIPRIVSSDDLFGILTTNYINCFWRRGGRIRDHCPENELLVSSVKYFNINFKKWNLLWSKRIDRATAPCQCIHIHQLSFNIASWPIPATSCERFSFIIRYSIGKVMRMRRRTSWLK